MKKLNIKNIAETYSKLPDSLKKRNNGMLIVAILSLAAFVYLIIIKAPWDIILFPVLVAVFLVLIPILSTIRYAEGNYYRCEGICAKKDRSSLLPNSDKIKRVSVCDYEVVCTDEESGKEFIVVLENQSASLMKAGLVYELVFVRNGAELGTRNFVSCKQLKDKKSSAGFTPEAPSKN